jgi:lipopolysaccharide exporter
MKDRQKSGPDPGAERPGPVSRSVPRHRVGAVGALSVHDVIAAFESPPERLALEDTQRFEQVSGDERVGRGVAWSAINTSTLRVGQLLMGLITARIVSPHQFGIFAVALTIYTIIINFSDVGVGAALLRDSHRTRELGPTVYTITVATSMMLSAGLIVAAPYLARALGAASATDAVRVLALTLLFSGFGTVSSTLLLRDYRQRTVFYADGAFFVVANGLLVILALHGDGVMALAWSRVAAQAVQTIFFIALAPERFWPGWNTRVARELLKFGSPLAASNLLGFTLSNSDFIAISRIRGSLQLGYYNLAYNISGWPVSLFTGVLTNITLTTLSRVREYNDALRTHVRAALGALCAAAFPVSALSVALSHPLVVLVYGSRWAPAGAALAAVSVFGSLRVMIALFSDLLVAVGRTRRLMVLQFIWLVVLIPAMIFGVEWKGIVGAGIAHVAVAIVVVIPLYILSIRRQLGIGFRWTAAVILPPFLASVLAWGAAYSAVLALHNLVAQLLVGAAAGLVAYLIAAWWWLWPLLATLRRLYGRGAGSADKDLEQRRDVAVHRSERSAEEVMR